MDKFEFIAVLLSIIFGLALTNLLSGILRAFFMKELTDTRLAWSLAVGIILLVNWWGFFLWSDNPEWHFLEFVFLAAWATTHYLLAVSLYPYDFLDVYTEELQRKFLFWTMLVVVIMDVVEAAIGGELFNPWYYPLFMAFLASLVIVPLTIPRPAVLRACGWILFVSILVWSTIVRGVLVS
jgi:hypothetical protein